MLWSLERIPLDVGSGKSPNVPITLNFMISPISVLCFPLDHLLWRDSCWNCCLLPWEQLRTNDWEECTANSGAEVSGEQHRRDEDIWPDPGRGKDEEEVIESQSCFFSLNAVVLMDLRAGLSLFTTTMTSKAMRLVLPQPNTATSYQDLAASRH